jgi:hypothetical protein
MEYTYCDRTFSDLHKDATGRRPSVGEMQEWEDRTPRQKQELWNALCDELAQNEVDERRAEEEAVEKFEQLVSQTIEYGASDRKAALRWITQTETFWHSQSVEHFVWEQGVLFTEYGKKLVDELIPLVTFKTA